MAGADQAVFCVGLENQNSVCGVLLGHTIGRQRYAVGQWMRCPENKVKQNRLDAKNTPDVAKRKGAELSLWLLRYWYTCARISEPTPGS